MSTAQNLRMLFNTYHNGFDNYGAWYGRHKTMHAKHPLECKEFGAEWLRRWEAVGRLLERQCVVEWYTYIDKRWLPLIWHGTVADAVEYITGQYALDPDDTWGRRMRIIHNGTIVREWPAT